MVFTVVKVWIAIFWIVIPRSHHVGVTNVSEQTAVVIFRIGVTENERRRVLRSVDDHLLHGGATREITI